MAQKLKLFRFLTPVISAHIIMLLTSLLFFSRFFYPEFKLCLCPDFGLGDVMYYNFPIKSFVAESLKRGELPLWNKDVGTGFPIFAEGQTGIFFIPNILFILLNTSQAFIFEYIITNIITASGTYFFLRKFKFSHIVSLFSGLIFSYSGYFVAQINHINLIQAVALIPWTFLAVENLRDNKTLNSSIILAIVLSQQFFAGYTQISFITVIFIFCYLIVRILLDAKVFKKFVPNRQIFRIAFLLILSGFLTIGLTSIQLLPSQELLKLSIRKEGLPFDYASNFSFHPKQFVNFLNPFLLGSPKDGTYPENLGVSFFWENTGYIGLLSLIFFAFSFFNRKRREFFITNILLLILSGLLMMGKLSPLYFVFSFTPFNYFRVPSRFLAIFVFCLMVGSAIGLEQITILTKNMLAKKSAMKVALIILLPASAVIQLISTWFFYQPTTSPNKVNEKPETVEYILSQNNKDRVYTLAGDTFFKQYYLEKGWTETAGYYFFRNLLVPNINLLWNIPHMYIYTGNIETLRLNYFLLFVNEELKVQFQKPENITPTNNLLSLANVRYITSAYIFENNDFLKKSFETKENIQNIPPIKIYENPKVLPRIRIVYKYQNVSTIDEIKDALLSSEFKPEEEIILEEKIDFKNLDLLYKNSIKLIKDTHQEIIIDASTEKRGLLVLADSYFPGWEATIDGNLTKIYPGNLNQKVIIVPEGNHTIKFKYKPKSLRYGSIISFLSLVITILLIAFPSFYRRHRKARKRI